MMKKQLMTLSLLGLVISCGSDADKIKLESKLFKTPLTSNFTAKASDLDTTLRGITLIAYPNASDMEGFSYKLSDELFEKVFNSEFSSLNLTEKMNLSASIAYLTPYGSKMKNGVDAGDSNERKVQDIVSQIVNVGDVRDRAYEAYVKNEESVAELRNFAASVESTIEEEFDFYRISGTPEGKDKLKKKYTLSKVDGYKYKSKVYEASSCEQFIKRRYKKIAFELLTEEELASLNAKKAECDDLDQVNSNLDNVDEIQNDLIFGNGIIGGSSIFKAGKTYVTELLSALEDKSKTSLLFTGIAKESVLDGTYNKDRAREIGISEIEFKEDGSGFEKFSLVLEFEKALGPKVYSVENGLIKNLRIEEFAPGMKTVKFDIIGNKINVSLDLGLTSMRRFGVRMIGDAHFSFSNGTKKRGVMKIEIDSKSDKSLPFEL